MLRDSKIPLSLQMGWFDKRFDTVKTFVFLSKNELLFDLSDITIQAVPFQMGFTHTEEKVNPIRYQGVPLDVVKNVPLLQKKTRPIT